jgi:hypothetical protein
MSTLLFTSWLDADHPTWSRCVDVATVSFAPLPGIVVALLDQIKVSCLKSEVLLDLASLADTPQVALVPLAGVLLEYPVAYVVPPEATAYLSQVLLDVYECAFHFDQSGITSIERQHTLLKYSCPNVLGSAETSLHPDTIVELLRTHFEARLNQAWEQHAPNDPVPRLSVHHTTVTLDRVAL